MQKLLFIVAVTICLERLHPNTEVWKEWLEKSLYAQISRKINSFLDRIGNEESTHAKLAL